MAALQILYPKMLHLTCKAHALHRVAELIRAENPLVNTLISTGKSIFVKAPHRIQTFKELAPNIPLPPSPVITRWGTWIDAATYYKNNFEVFNEVVLKLDKSQAVCIEKCQEVLQNPEIVPSLSVISSQLSILSTTIKKLEARGLPLSESIKLIAEVQTALDALYDKKYLHKLQSMLNKNINYSTFLSINSILKGSSEDKTDEFIKCYTPSHICCFKYAPVVSCDVERVFSQYKTVLADNRRRLNFENLKALMIIKCNEYNDK